MIRSAGSSSPRHGAGLFQDEAVPTATTRSGGAGVVDEHLLPGAAVLAHRALERGGEGLVELAELRVAPGAAFRVGSHVLLPQQHQRDALALELAVDAAPVGDDDGQRCRRARLQGGRELLFAPVLDGVPVQAGGGGQPDVLGDRALGGLQSGGDLCVRELRVPFQADHLLDHAQRDSFFGHSTPRWQKTVEGRRPGFAFSTQHCRRGRRRPYGAPLRLSRYRNGRSRCAEIEVRSRCPE